MGTRERPVDRANRHVGRLLLTTGHELREARVGAGLSLREVGSAAGVSHSTLSRIERGRSPEASIVVLARVAATVGLELGVRLYPDGDPIRDAAQVSLLGRLRDRCSPKLRWQYEAPLPIPGDRRAWDAVILGVGVRIGVEAETRLRDAQAVARRINLKQRDAEMDHVILLVADTRANRAAIAAARAELAELFPVAPRVALRALAEGRSPGGNTLILL
jgi:transcriptional regulator with XRE-family HTH domain